MTSMSIAAAQSPGASVKPATRYLPLAIDLHGLACLVVGAGRVGTRKARSLLEAGARVTVVAPKASSWVIAAADRGEVRWIPDEFSSDHILRCFLLVAATDDPRLNLEIRDLCEEQGILSCVVSPGRHSRVIFPAICRCPEITVAVHSDGRDCSASREVRSRIAAVLREGQPGAPVLSVLTINRGSVPEPFFTDLVAASRGLSGPELVGRDCQEGMVLATCRRWECWFLSPTPAAGTREIRERIENRCGLLLEAHAGSLHLRSGPRAELHLLRLAAGLLSPLLGEREIVGQLRKARDHFLPAVASPLRRIVDGALHGQRDVRRISGIASPASWSRRAAEVVCGGLRAEGSRRVLIAGLGTLGRALLRRLRAEGVAAVAVSSHTSPVAGVVFPRDHLLSLARSVDTIALTSVTPAEHEALARLAQEQPVLRIVDLTSDKGLRETASLSLDGTRVAAAAKASAHAFTIVVGRTGPLALSRTIRLVGRGTRLSQAQVEEVLRFLRPAMPESRFELQTLETPSDGHRVTPLSSIRSEDFFTGDLDQALLTGQADLAVHSAKDLPSSLAPGLIVAAVLPAFAPWECLVSRDGSSLDRLPAGACVGVSSERRQARLLELRPDLATREIRGPVPERLAQMDRGDYDALLLAAAGLIRLGLEARIAQVFEAETFPPPPGQGALALVTREDNQELRAALSALDLGDREGLPWA